MSIFPLLFSVVAVAGSLGLAAWSWLAMTNVDDALRTFTGFERIHFDI
jgi:hypothetical protein